MNILMVMTSHDTLGNTGRKTGFWLEEFCARLTTRSSMRVLTLQSLPPKVVNRRSIPRATHPRGRPT